MKTLVTTSSTNLSSVITVATNQYAVVKSADYQDGGLLIINLPGNSFTNNFTDNSVTGLTIAGPATIQLQAQPYSYIPTFVTIQVKDNESQSSPSTAVVIPTDATGPVNIILESSSDLVNWTSALPGTYGSSATNRFFRVRAVRQ